jgi:NAD(P)-dependent dehydrogenase (short-subunit alcohol dehydrogenase family)
LARLILDYEDWEHALDEERWNISTKRVLITGATNGIGLAAAIELARRGSSLILTARSEERAESVVARLREIAPQVSVEFLYSDLSLMADVDALASSVIERFGALDVLINNAGAIFKSRRETLEGFEQTWALNHLCPFLLTARLRVLLEAAPSARVITTSSGAHHFGALDLNDLDAKKRYRPFGRYGQTKLANILFTSELARRLDGTEVAAYCYHPGLVATGFNKNNGPAARAVSTLTGMFSRTPARGAQTMVWLASEPTTPLPRGGYFVDEKPRTPSVAARDQALARHIWEVTSEQLRPWLSPS